MNDRLRTRCITVDPAQPDAAVIDEAAALLRAGRLVAFPTETVYGLGANALDAQALRRIYVAKERPASDPIIAHIAATAQLPRLARDLPRCLEALAARFWPGPLTLILRRAAGVPAAIAEGRDTIAVRMPAHPVAQALLRAARIPVGAPSANRFTRPSATTAAHVLEDLDGRVDLVLDAGPASIGVESTVLDLTAGVPRVLRPGGVGIEALRELLPATELAPRFVSAATQSDAPGQMLRHYAPRARVTLYRGPEEARVLAAMASAMQALQDAGRRVGLLLASEDAPQLPAADAVVILASRDDLEGVSRRLFLALRDLDRAGVDAILVRDFGGGGLADAIHDRLLRAAEGRLVEA